MKCQPFAGWNTQHCFWVATLWLVEIHNAVRVQIVSQFYSVEQKYAGWIIHSFIWIEIKKNCFSVLEDLICKVAMFSLTFFLLLTKVFFRAQKMYLNFRINLRKWMLVEYTFFKLWDQKIIVSQIYTFELELNKSRHNVLIYFFIGFLGKI